MSGRLGSSNRNTHATTSAKPGKKKKKTTKEKNSRPNKKKSKPRERLPRVREIVTVRGGGRGSGGERITRVEREYNNSWKSMFPWNWSKSQTKCAKAGCPRWAKPIHTKDGGRVVKQAPYCERHLCDQWRSDDNCLRKKDGNSRFCKYHRGCVIDGCRYSRKDTDPKFKYCIELHGCVWSKCEDARRKSGESSYCDNHACANLKCKDGILRDGLKVCKAHKCHDAACGNEVPGTEDLAKSKELNYCDLHRECQEANCNRRIYFDGKQVAHKFCPEHECKISDVCDKSRVPGEGAEACADHTCRKYYMVPSCNKPKSGIGNTYCKEHECKVEKCVADRYETKELCKDHLCMADILQKKQCGNEREGTASNQFYCKDHRICEEKGCEEFIVLENGRRKDKCEKHIKPQCEILNCTEPATAPVANPRYCAQHTCAYSQCDDACLGLPVLFCDYHRCNEPGCVHAAVTGTPPGGVNPLQLMSLGTGRSALAKLLSPPRVYCADHKCEVINCNGRGEKRNGGSAILCSSHCCKAKGCGARINEEGVAWCSAHKCRERECTEKALEDGGWCREHGDEDDWDGGWGGWGARGTGRGRRRLYGGNRW
ncbi:hypothetical protein GGR57DRAFT_369881 [Xylariaceae sp. FL1272]|nr:hypothetical protein GGR57DRAFT_369881 [Xylariaceae sp. FL1272]